MKKSILFLATLAILSVFSCQKEDNQKLTPVDSANLTEITANASDADTKAYVDGLQVKWNAGDVIAVENASHGLVEFELTSGANTASAKFGGDLGSSTLGTYAVYPNSTNADFKANEVYTDYLDSWNYGKSEVPMYGVNNGSGVYTFNNIGGAIQVTYSNIPATTLGKYFVISETHTTGSEKYITGPVIVSDLDSTPSIDLDFLDGQVVSINNIPNDATDVTLVIPVPAGTGYNFKVELYEVGATDPIAGSVKNASNRTITAGKILRFPTIAFPLQAPADAKITDISIATKKYSGSWSTVANATNYDWMISTSATAPASTSDASVKAYGNATTNSFSATVDTAPTAATVYYLYVKANADGYTSSSYSKAHAILYQHVFGTGQINTSDTQNDVTLSTIKWDKSGSKIGSYNSGNYAGIQFGDKNNSGSLSFTSDSAWGSQASTAYYGYSTVKLVRVWLNAGTGTPTATVTVGGKSATSDGTTVTKNSSASSYADATAVTFTPASDGKTGVVVISASTSSKAGYFCAMEVLSE